MSILVWSHIGGLLVSTPYLLLKADIHTIPVAYWPFFGILAVLILVALTSFYKAVQTSPISLVSPIVSAHLVVVIFVIRDIYGRAYRNGATRRDFVSSGRSCTCFYDGE